MPPTLIAPVRHLSRKSAGLLLLLAAPLLLGAPALAQEPDPVISRVNGAEIRASDIALAEEELGQNLPPATPEGKREYIISYLTDTLLVAQAAEKEKLDQTEDFKRKLAFMRHRLLSESLLTRNAKDGVTDEAMHQVYDEAVKQMSAEKEVRARHILFRVEDPKDEAASKAAEAKAKAVVEQLKGGADFAKLAGELTEDPSGKADGGDLGYFTKDQMVPEFSEVAFKMEPGKVSAPVKSQFGWHVIKVEDKRDRPVPEFDKVKDQLQVFVARKSQTDLVTKLRADAKIERVEPKPAAAPAPAVPPAAAPKN